jgi:hypothetical protein
MQSRRSSARSYCPVPVVSACLGSLARCSCSSTWPRYSLAWRYWRERYPQLARFVSCYRSSSWARRDLSDTSSLSCSFSLSLSHGGGQAFPARKRASVAPARSLVWVRRPRRGGGRHGGPGHLVLGEERGHLPRPWRRRPAPGHGGAVTLAPRPWQGTAPSATGAAVRWPRHGRSRFPDARCSLFHGAADSPGTFWRFRVHDETGRDPNRSKI